MQVDILDVRNLTQEDAEAIGQLLATIWPNPDKPAEYRTAQLLANKTKYSGQEQLAPKSFVVREEGSIVAHAAMLPRTIHTSRGEFTIAGLAQVCTAPESRGRGLGETVVRAAFESVDSGTYPWSLFQTSTKVRAFYERLGACEVSNRIVNSLADDPDACPFWDSVVMRYPQSGPWPDGQIDLRGPGY